MRIKPDQLAASLQKGLAPIYFISGDEPLQLGEMADAIRREAKKAGYENREILEVDSKFSWHKLTESAGSISIFADKKIIDLRMPTGSPGTDGSKALISYCEHLPEDTLLLITSAKLATASLKARWFTALDKAACVIQVWPMEGPDLFRWLEQRMQKRGLHAETEGIRILASRIEGNLLAAAQEIEKLYVLYGSGHLGNQQILEVVADSSRFDVFKLMDSVLAAKITRVLKILSGLKSEGIAVPVVLWALTREARSLIKMKLALSQGQNKAMVFKDNQIWDKRQQLVADALNRLDDSGLYGILALSATADRQSKGQQPGDPWETLREICLMFAAPSGRLVANR
jgi:DNA polymerase-3 subunit delta